MVSPDSNPQPQTCHQYQQFETRASPSLYVSRRCHRCSDNGQASQTERRFSFPGLLCNHYWHHSPYGNNRTSFSPGQTTGYYLDLSLCDVPLVINPSATPELAATNACSWFQGGGLLARETYMLRTTGYIIFASLRPCIWTELLPYRLRSRRKGLQASACKCHGLGTLKVRRPLATLAVAVRPIVGSSPHLIQHTLNSVFRMTKSPLGRGSIWRSNSLRAILGDRA